MNLLYFCHFIFLYASMIFTRVSINTFQSTAYWNRLAEYDTMSDVDKRYYIAKTEHLLYWINADRFYWKSGDLQHLAEAFFAMGNVVSICRICFLLPIIAFVGPLQVRRVKRQILLTIVSMKRTYQSRILFTATS
jgi:hypothetical protein